MMMMMSWEHCVTNKKLQQTNVSSFVCGFLRTQWKKQTERYAEAIQKERGGGHEAHRNM